MFYHRLTAGAISQAIAGFLAPGEQHNAGIPADPGRTGFRDTPFVGSPPRWLRRTTARGRFRRVLATTCGYSPIGTVTKHADRQTALALAYHEAGSIGSAPDAWLVSDGIDIVSAARESWWRQNDPSGANSTGLGGKIYSPPSRGVMPHGDRRGPCPGAATSPPGDRRGRDATAS